MKMKKILSALLAGAVMLSTMCFGVSAVTAEAVAKIGDAEYTTLAAAVEAAVSGDTITLAADTQLSATVTIPEGKSITLDLAGNDITVTKSGDRSLYALNNNGTLTLTDTVGDGSITARGNYNYGTMIMNGGTVTACDTNGGYGIWNYGSFTMNGGTIKVTHVGSYNDQFGPTGLGNMSGATATITGGIFDGKSARAYIIASEGTMTISPDQGKEVKLKAPRGIAIDNGTAVINGGVFEVYDAGSAVAIETYYALYVSGGESVIVNGGTFKAPDQSLWNTGTDTDVTIHGGSFTAPISGKTEEHKSQNITIYGGNFEAPISGNAEADENQNITIYGGTFKETPAKEFLAEGVKSETKPDGSVVVSSPSLEASASKGFGTYILMLLLTLKNRELDIEASATEGGTITPAGTTSVKYNKSQTYTIVPDEGYEIASVIVDGEDMGAVTEYTFKRVKKAHTISVIFAEIQ